MSFWRKTGLFVAGVLLPLLLFVWGLIFSVYNVFGTSDNIKQALDTSGVYQTFARDLLQHQQKQEGQPDGEIPLNQPEVQQIVTDAASPDFLKREVEIFLDNTYAWISGESQRINLEINLTDIKTKLTEGLTQHATARLNSLPVCSAPTSSTQDFDPFSAECTPQGLDKNTALNEIKGEINKTFKDPVITQDDIKNDKGKTLEEQLQGLQTAYQNITFGLWIGMLLILLCTAGVVWLTQPWQKGLKRAGWVFVGIGALSAAFAILAAFALGKIVEQVGIDNVQPNAVSVLKTLAGDLRTWWLGFGVVVLVLGVAALVGPKFGKKSNVSAHEEKREETPLDKKEAGAQPPAPAPTNKPKRKI